MPVLRYVGSSPSADLSVVNRKILVSELESRVPGGASPVQQARDRGATYPTASELDAVFGNKVTYSKADSFKSGYVLKEDAGQSIATISTDGFITKAEWPANYTPYKEPDGRTFRVRSLRGSYSSSFDSTIASITIPDPGFSWSPLITGYAEFDLAATNAGALKVKDSLARVLAEGYSRIGDYSTAVLGQKSAPTYTGSQRMDIVLGVTRGTDGGALSGNLGMVAITAVPA